MNFSYLEHQTEFSALYTACRDAEEFALTKPDISATSARKAMEFIVKYIYMGFEPYPAYSCTVYDMIRDPRFKTQFADPSMLDSIDFIRRTGNTAVHRGNLDVDEAMQVLQHLHFLTGEFAIGVGLISEYAAFVKPEPDIIGDILSRIHSDNIFLNLLPYVNEAGHEDWSELLSSNRMVHIDDFSDIPEELKNDEFLDFLRNFEQSMKTEVADILNLLPISSATDREWQERRSSVPKSAIAKVECYVEAYIADNQRSHTQKWTYYNEALGEKAAAYLQLVHPDYVPESMRSAYVKPDAAEIGASEEFISLEAAVKQLLRYIVAENPRKRELLSMSGWCKTNLGVSIPVIRTSIGSNHPDRELYSKDKVHMGDKKFYVFLSWNRTTLLRLRQEADELGETLVTQDNLADWGFAIPGSEAEKRAKERAEKRELLAQAQNQTVLEETKSEDTSKPRRKYTKTATLPEDEVSSQEVRAYILGAGLANWLPRLTSAEWCKMKLGFEYPLLISFDERQYLLKKQKQRGEAPYVYSRTICEYNGKNYYVKRMKSDEFDQLKALIELS